MCHAKPLFAIHEYWSENIIDFNEEQRAQLLSQYGILDTAPEQAFDEIVSFAAALCEAPIALISFVTADRQWFKARVGINVRETPRSQSFCALAMQGTAIMSVPDAAADPRFAENPLVTGGPRIRFYAGAPLRSSDGVPLGSLCVIDGKPREKLTPLQEQGLQVLADQVMSLLELRRRLHLKMLDDQRLAESEEKFRVLADAMPQMVWSALPDGFNDYFNARWYEFTGVPEGACDGEGWNTVVHPDDQARAWEIWRHSLATGEPYEIEYRLRHHSGEYRWTLGRALPIRGASGEIIRWFGTCTDIDETKRNAEERELVAHELSHRIKNIFAVIGGLISLSARTQPEIKPLAEDLRTRVMALGRAHDFVRPHSATSRPDMAGVTLHGLLGELFRAYDSMDGVRIAIRGVDYEVDDRAATPLALLFHELATNAAKYGALSAPDGTVTVEVDADKELCRIRWIERGGPPVETRPELTGFGSKLIQLSVNAQLKGRIEKTWDTGALTALIEIPLNSLKRDR